LTPFLVLWLLAMAAWDFRHRRIPNWLAAAGAACGLAALAWGGQPWSAGWVDALTGAAAAFAALLVFYAAGLMGAGDVKFAGALGLWTGLAPLLPIWAGASLLAGVHALLWWVLQRWPLFPRLALALGGTRDDAGGNAQRTRRRPIPFGAYLALAALCWMAWAPARP
jgi:prepilin peptidase CpaA